MSTVYECGHSVLWKGIPVSNGLGVETECYVRQWCVLTERMEFVVLQTHLRSIRDSLLLLFINKWYFLLEADNSSRIFSYAFFLLLLLFGFSFFSSPFSSSFLLLLLFSPVFLSFFSFLLAFCILYAYCTEAMCQSNSTKIHVTSTPCFNPTLLDSHLLQTLLMTSSQHNQHWLRFRATEAWNYHKHIYNEVILNLEYSMPVGTTHIDLWRQ